MNKEEEIKFKKKIKEETISREDELIDAAKRNAAIVSEFLIGAKWADQYPSVDTVKKIICYALKHTNIMFAENLESIEWDLLIKKAMED